MTDPVRIDRVFPTQDAVRDLTDDALAESYRGPREPWLRVNFVSSVDGAVTRDGRSGGLGDEADRRVFEVLRRLCDVVLVGAGTIRAEGYGGMAVDERSAAWRTEHGFAPQPRLAIVSGRLDLRADDAVFAEALEPPLVVTSRAADAERVRELSAVAEVLRVGRDGVDAAGIVPALAEVGYPRITCEGGPGLLGSLARAGAVDELCVTVSPLLVGGSAGRIARTEAAVDARLRLAQVLASGSTLMTRYLRDDDAPR